MSKSQAKTKTTARTMEQVIASWPEKKRALLETLPKHAFEFKAAGIAVGYSPGYAERSLKRVMTHDSTFCEALLAKRRELEAGTQDERGKALQRLDRIIAKDGANDRDVIKAIEVKGKMCNWLVETRVWEIGSRQRELDESEQAEAKWIASQRFNTASLPGDTAQKRSIALTTGDNGEQNAIFEPVRDSNALNNASANEGQRQLDPASSTSPVDDSMGPAGSSDPLCTGFADGLGTASNAQGDVPTAAADGPVPEGPIPPSGRRATPSPVDPEFFGAVASRTPLIANPQEIPPTLSNSDQIHPE